MNPNSRHHEGLRRLRQYESATLVSSAYERLHGLELPADKAKSITYSVRQSRELLEGARFGDYSTRPIQLYYGLSALGRAMTLISDSDIVEAELSHNHGISVSPLPAHVNSAEEVLNLYINFQKGEFTQWNEKTQVSFPMRVQTSRADFTYAYESKLVGKRIKLGEIVSLIPDVWPEIEMVDGQSAPTRVAVQSVQNEATAFSLKGKSSQQYIESCFPGIEATHVSGMNNSDWSVDLRDMARFRPQLVQQNEDGFNIGSVLVVPPVGDVRLTTLGSFTSVAFAMSMLARYRPSIWGAIWNGATANELVPLFERLMNVVQTWAPYVLDENLDHILHDR